MRAHQRAARDRAAVAHRLPLLRSARRRARARAHGAVRCQRSRQDERARSDRLGRPGRSFRGVPDRALVRTGCDEAILRIEVAEGERRQLLEVAIRAVGANRVLLNRNRLNRTRDLSGLLRVTVFSPDDLELVKGGPSGRRDFLDDLLSGLAPRYEAARRLRAGAAPSQRAPAGRHPRRRRPHDTRRVRRAVGAVGRGVGSGPPASDRTPRAGARDELRAARGTAKHGRGALRGRVVGGSGHDRHGRRRRRYLRARSRRAASARSTAGSRWSARIATSCTCS